MTVLEQLEAVYKQQEVLHAVEYLAHYLFEISWQNVSANYLLQCAVVVYLKASTEVGKGHNYDEHRTTTNHVQYRFAIPPPQAVCWNLLTLQD